MLTIDSVAVRCGNPSMVDVPVEVRIWTRPLLQKEQFECLRREKPSAMILVSDGGRTPDEMKLIMESRSVFDSIDWDCEVHRLYWDANAGMYETASKSANYIWSKYDRCIWLEDDIMFAEGFIRFCAEMLERYKDDERVLAVCGMNHEGESNGPNADYFFSREASIWGLAIWRRSYHRPTEILDSTLEYEREMIVKNAKLNPDFQRRLRGYAENPTYEGHVPAGEFWHALAAFGNNQLYIVPTRNMICNKGCTTSSTHADDFKMLPKGMRRIFEMETYSPPAQLRHPALMVPDVRYEKAVYRIMAVGHPLVRLYRKAVRAAKILYRRGPSALFAKLGNAAKPKFER